MAFIRTIEYEESMGELRQEYDEAIKRAGLVYNIVKIMGLGPRQLRASIDLYVQIMHMPAGLSRAQRELLAVVVSMVNRCHY